MNRIRDDRRKLAAGALCLALLLCPTIVATAQKTKNARRTPDALLNLPRLPQHQQYNIIYILLDGQRYDALGFLKGQAFLKTPNMDTIARNGVYLPNAFVTTALCSPADDGNKDFIKLKDARYLSLNGPFGPTFNNFGQLIPNRKIDYIFAKDGTKVFEHGVLADQLDGGGGGRGGWASDHLPVLAEIAFGGK